MAVQEFIDALKLEIFAQYNAARTDPLEYAKTAGLPARAVELLQDLKPVPAFGAISVELSNDAMKKVLARRAFFTPAAGSLRPARRGHRPNRPTSNLFPPSPSQPVGPHSLPPISPPFSDLVLLNCYC
jgi:hypothetical protein